MLPTTRIPLQRLLLVAPLMTAIVPALAQNTHLGGDILLRDGVIRTSSNVHGPSDGPVILDGGTFRGHSYHLLQFDHVLDARERAELDGVELLEYIPHGTYVASVARGTDPSTLVDHGLVWAGPYGNDLKLHPHLKREELPAEIERGNGVHVMVRLHRDVPFETMEDLVRKVGVEVINTFPHAGLFELVVAKERLVELASLAAVATVEPGPPEGEPEDLLGQSLHRSNGLNTRYAGGPKYDGTGVSIAVNDDGFVGPHIDFQGRTEQSDVAGDLTGDHGDMVAGIAGGAGNIDPDIQGMAPGAFLWIRQYSSSLPNTVTLHQNNGVMVFNSSYSNGCNAGYTAVTQMADQEIINNPTLIQTFSAGNSNGSDCGYGAGNQWGNITGGHKIGKNVIAAANLLNDETLVGSSSRGPASDGRIKPDIASNGNGQLSTDPNNTYSPGGGTSAAAPGIMGVMAQLMHAHRDLNGGADAPSGLLKACLLNTAHDLGNTGPDFKFGWGRVNVTRAYGILSDGRYLSDAVDQGATNQHGITVPAGVDELRVMVYWMDPAGSTVAAKALVNDLDMTLTDPSSNVLLPWVLDPTPDPALLDLPASTGVDTLNNVEQVAVLSPSAGTYTVSVSGSEVPMGPQAYFIVWEFIQGITLTYPIGGEGLEPGTTERIHWDATGDQGSFTLEYSSDGGNTWNSITTVPGSARMYDWTVPNTISGKVRVRISRNGIIGESTADLSIVSVPSSLQVVRVCPTDMRVSWNAVPGANAYIVHLLGAQYMDSVGSTSLLFYDIPIADPNQEQWFSVTAIGPDGLRSERAVAVHYPGGGLFNCSVTNDLSVLQIDEPAGSYLACNSLVVPVTVEVFNPGLADQSGFPISYQLDNGGVVTESFTGNLPSGAQVPFTFGQQLTLPASGSGVLRAWTSLAGDGAAFNDTAQVTITIIGGTPAAIPLTEDFEGQGTCAVTTDCEATDCPLAGGWSNALNGTDDDIDWRVNTGGTVSSGTGPSVDQTLGTSAGKYVYLEASGTCSFRTAMLISPCVDLSGTQLPTLSYWYHLYGTGMGELHVDLYDGTAWVTDIAPPISGDQGDQWIQETVDLSNWIGQTVVIRFRGITGGDFTSDMALDQIAILDVAAPPVVSFVADPPAGCLGDVVTLVDLSQNLPTAWSWDIQPATGVNYVNGTSSSSATPQVVFTQAGTYSVALTASNMFGGSTVTQPSAVQQVDGVGLAMAVTTDRYGSETTWTVTGGTSTYASGGPYATVSASGAYPQDTVLFCVPGGTCMDLTVYDSFGDGMCCAYGAGGYQLLTLTGDTLVNGDGQFTTVRTDNFCAPYNLRLQLRAWLEGAHLAGSTLMRDDLRASGLIPLVSPYPALGFIGAEDATISPSVLATTGPDAIVDWVLIELRDPASPSTIVRTAGALLQRDGDVVATDGISPVTILGDAASYLVAIRHRNHLGAMLLNAVPLGGATAVLDLTDGSVPMWGSGALNNLNGTWALASGNVVVDGTMKYTGIDNDRDPILQAIGGAVPTNTVTGYSNADLNMDGIVQYAGVGNDRDIILDNIGGSLPTAVRPEQLP